MVKFSEIVELLSKNTLLLENIFSANYKEFERLWYPLYFQMSVPMLYLEPTKMNTKPFEFSFSYYCVSINVATQGYFRAGVGLEINGQYYPSEGYQIWSSGNHSPRKSTFFSYPAVPMVVYDFKLYIDKPFILNIYAENTQTSGGGGQSIQFYINGYRINLEQILKVIRDNKVIYDNVITALEGNENVISE